MFSCIYVEEALKKHPKLIEITLKYPRVPVVSCYHYKDVFNPGFQNFRAQKKKPALIIAEQKGQAVLPTPEGFGIGGSQNYYFSHMLNCIYDCEYCFLQGMYKSANFVYFINDDYFKSEIARIANSLNEPSCFFSGYDCDSLAMDPVTGFIDSYIPFFREIPNAILELRTKSTQTKALLSQDPIDNCVVAFSFTPDNISSKVEIGVPAVSKRIDAMQRLADHGWKIGLRLDPMIYADQFENYYKQLIEDLLSNIKLDKVHSVSLGPMRFPEKMYKKIVAQHPQKTLLAHPLENQNGVVSYAPKIEMAMSDFVRGQLLRYLPSHLLFECHNL